MRRANDCRLQTVESVRPQFVEASMRCKAASAEPCRPPLELAEIVRRWPARGRRAVLARCANVREHASRSCNGAGAGDILQHPMRSDADGRPSRGRPADPTLTEDQGNESISSRRPGVIALVLCWSASEPDRLGQALFVPPSREGNPYIFGRGDAEPDDPHPKIRLAAETNGEVVDQGSLGTPQISRRQLLLRAEAAEALEIQNVGRCRMFHNGCECTTARAVPGDTIRLGGQLLFLCVSRTVWNRSIPPGYEGHRFGRADSDGIVGESQAAWDLRSQIRFVAREEGHVLVTGASGTGKELVARAVHRQSKRSGAPIVARNAATFPEGIIDAELFGNMRNYPNPGMVERQGLVGAADGSSLFLDEIGDLSGSLQAHLLRVLDEGEYQRLGETTVRRSDFRLIAATNRPERLKHDFAARFRFAIEVPDLNARREDVPMLARHLLRDQEREALGFVTMEALVRRPYENNVRELEAAIWRALGGQSISSPSQPASAESSHESAQSRARQPGNVDPKTVTREAIEAAMKQHHGVLEQVWRALGLSSRHALNRLLVKYGMR
jgi:two-component system nitrogen regulation response regulator GlnG/two-component system response regulator HydG